LSLQFWKQFYFTVVLQGLRKTEQQNLSLFFKHNCTSFKMHVCANFFSGFQESNSMFKFELKVMLIGIRSKTNLFNHRLLRIGLDFLLLFLLFVYEFTVVYNLTNRRRSIWRNFNQVQFQFICKLNCFSSRI